MNMSMGREPLVYVQMKRQYTPKLSTWQIREKLNGTGYPFGKSAEELEHQCRLMVCLDIYQALREERPYKTGYTHSQSITILRDMVEAGFIDGDIVEDIDIVFKDA